MIAFLQEETPDGEVDKAQAEDDDRNPAGGRTDLLIYRLGEAAPK